MGEVTILGCGATYGVPLAGGSWGLCDQQNTRNARTRPTVFVTLAGQSLMIDIGPDFRLQTASAKLIPNTILITHGHWDHIAGIGELPYYVEQVLKGDMHIYADVNTLNSIRAMFSYLFSGQKIQDKTTVVALGKKGEYRIYWHEIRAFEPFEANGIAIAPFAQHHGAAESLGFRIADFAYSPDAKSFPAKSWPSLENLGTWVLDCDYWQPSDSHGDPETVLALFNQFNPRRVFLTHMDEKMDYETLTSWFKARGNDVIKPAFDGLKIKLKDGLDI